MELITYILVGFSVCLNLLFCYRYCLSKPKQKNQVLNDIKDKEDVQTMHQILYSDNLKNQSFTYTDSAYVRCGTLRWFSTIRADIFSVVAIAYDSPIGGSIVLDVNKNGVTIFQNQRNRPTITKSHDFVVSVPDDTEINLGDQFTVDIDQVGHIHPGGKIIVTIRYKEIQ